MQNLSKAHEKSVQTAVHTEQVDTILNNVENVPYALRGSTVKTILYYLFSAVAALELSAALFFYVSSLGTPKAVAMVGCGVIAFLFHGLLHSILTDTTKGMVFSKKRESKAMSAEVITNIVLSVFLLIMAACIVFFVGKKGFTAYRATQYEQAQAKPKDEVKEVTVDMLTNSKGKVAAWKLEALTDLEKAKAKTTEATTAQATADRQSYDATTANVTDIVGASAFVLELLLALLAYSIATAKYAAVFDEIARRNQVQAQAENEQKQPKNDEKASVTANVEANVSDEKATPKSDQEAPPQPQKRIGFQPQTVTGNEGRTVVKGFVKESTTASVTANVERPTPPPNTRVCQWCDEYFVYSIHNQKYCCEDCRIAAYQERTGKTLIKGKKK